MAAIDAVVETPGGSRNKFIYDEKRGLFRLHKILPRGSAFPYDFGFIPNTLAEDGDPIDVMVLGEEPTFTGCVVGVRLVGVVEARQTKDGRTIRNDRLIGVPEGPRIRPAVRSIDDLAPRLLEQIELFFVAYNKYEGRDFEVVGRKGPQAALAALERARRKFARSGAKK